MAPFKLKIEPAGVAMPCDGGGNLLDAALAAGFFPRHGCRRGQCNACETRILSGDVCYPGDFAPVGVRDGYILTCQARALTDIVIEAPEVMSTPGRRVVQAAARVLEVAHVSADVVRVRLKVPPGSGFSFRPGQYAEVILRDGARRSYSMANAPDPDGIIEWHIRVVPNGRFSNHAYRTLKPRDMLKIEGPFGSFMLSQSSAPIVLLASGTGYAPIAAMLDAHDAEIRQRGALLYWGGARLSDLYAHDQAREWAQSAPGCRFTPVLSGNEPEWTGRKGLVHEAVAADLPDLSCHEVYACGNPLMVDAARRTFVSENGLPATSFFSDAFVSGGGLV